MGPGKGEASQASNKKNDAKGPPARRAACLSSLSLPLEPSPRGMHAQRKTAAAAVRRRRRQRRLPYDDDNENNEGKIHQHPPTTNQRDLDYYRLDRHHPPQRKEKHVYWSKRVLPYCAVRFFFFFTVHTSESSDALNFSSISSTSSPTANE